jgi:hypothetical protein
LGGILDFLAKSPFHGEGYRKIHTALRAKGLRTAPKRIMRLMRENGLQATKRVGNPHGPKAHDGTIRAFAFETLHSA